MAKIKLNKRYGNNNSSYSSCGPCNTQSTLANGNYKIKLNSDQIFLNDVVVSIDTNFEQNCCIDPKKYSVLKTYNGTGSIKSLDKTSPINFVLKDSVMLPSDKTCFINDTNSKLDHEIFCIMFDSSENNAKSIYRIYSTPLHFKMPISIDLDSLFNEFFSNQKLSFTVESKYKEIVIS